MSRVCFKLEWKVVFSMNLSSVNSKYSVQRIVGFNREKDLLSQWLGASDACIYEQLYIRSGDSE